jgi:putative acyl-CoA dehydrogenase
MRQALARAVHHTQHRAAFGATLIDQPLMRNVLADLALESEAATLLAMRLAHAIDEGESDFARLGVASASSGSASAPPPMVAEALECLGGLGYVEENGLARLYREAPLNSIWEGSGNVNALDVLRAITREPASLAALAKECALRPRRDLVGGHDAIDEIERRLHPGVCRGRALAGRSLVERLALTLQASLLVRYAPPAVAEAFSLTRLGRDHGMTFGTLPAAIASRRCRSHPDRAGQAPRR